MPQNLTLNRKVGSDGFRVAVARWAAEGATTARQLENAGTAQALEEFGEYLSNLDLEDQTHRALYTISGAAGWGTEGTWSPGESASEFRANLGYLHRPTPAEALAELTAACLDDFIRIQGERHAKLTKRAEEALAEAARLEAADLRCQELETENERLLGELSGALNKLTEAEQQNDQLRRRHDPEPKPSRKRAKASNGGKR